MPHPTHHPQSQSQSQPQPQPKPNPNLLSLFLKPIIMLILTSLFFLFIGFAAFLLLHLFLLGGAFHRLRFRPSSATASASNALLPREINKLPRFRLSRGSHMLADSHCVVCLDAFRSGQCCRKLAACGHVFHRRCVDTWLLKVAACPTCRTRVRFNAGPPVHDATLGSAFAQFQACETDSSADTLL